MPPRTVEVHIDKQPNSGKSYVSVIVPMYKMEAYITDCVNSILNQTLSNIEIILVDDGSPDDCGKIAEKYARSDSRVKVVHRDNGGLGPARNSGIESASGEYIGFVDADDWVEPQMYEHLYACALNTGADIVYGGIKTIRNGSVAHIRRQPFGNITLNGEEEIFNLRSAFYGALPARVKRDPMTVSACVAIYKRSLLEENDIRFINVLSEDRFFNTIACRAAKSIACIDEADYCYRKDGQSSITNSFNRGTIDTFFSMLGKLLDLAETEDEAYVDECRTRAKRCVIDYSRLLICGIANSGISNKDKLACITDVLERKILCDAYKGYPAIKLPIKQAAFLLCVERKSAFLCKLLAGLHR